MHKLTLASILAAASIATSPALATAPTAGTYAAAVYVNAASGSGCLDYAGNSYAGALNYLGFSATKLALRIPLVASGQAGVSTTTLTVTSGAGTLAPKGSFNWKASGIGVTSFSQNGTFAASIKEIDGTSFAAQVKETYNSAYGSCTETLLVALTRVGSSQ